MKKDERSITPMMAHIKYLNIMREGLINEKNAEAVIAMIDASIRNSESLISIEQVHIEKSFSIGQMKGYEIAVNNADIINPADYFEQNFKPYKNGSNI